MGGYFAVTSERDCLSDVFFGTDYHSHLGTSNAGMAAWSREDGLQREIHSIKTAPFRTKFASIMDSMRGTAAMGIISDSDPQPLLIRSRLGCFAVGFTGIISNSDELVEKYILPDRGHLDAMGGGKINSTELLASLISLKDTFTEGIVFAQEVIDGTACVIILREDGSIIAARDRFGRLPVHIGCAEGARAVSFEAFAYQKLGFADEYELGPGEIAEIHPDRIGILSKARSEKKLCAFLFSYYGYPTSTYEGVNVEMMRYANGRIMAENEMKNGDLPEIDYIGGVPDSGTPHAIGYAAAAGIPFARAFIKYTPTWARSFMPDNQSDRNRVARMKQLPIRELIEGKKLMFVDDSIVRGTQMRETVEFLYENGAKQVHMRSASPPIMCSCKYLNFSRQTDEKELIARRVILSLEGEEGLSHLDEYSDGATERGQKLRRAISEELGFDSLDFQSVDGIVRAIGMDKCELCTYCWDGKE